MKNKIHVSVICSIPRNLGRFALRSINSTFKLTSKNLRHEARKNHKNARENFVMQSSEKFNSVHFSNFKIPHTYNLTEK